MEEQFDRLARRLAEGKRSRRQALKLMGAAVGGTAMALFTGRASAAPRTCLTCVCGVGRPCNPKTTVCTEQRAFPSPEAACGEACTQAGFKFCGGVTQFHCPHGCP